MRVNKNKNKLYLSVLSAAVAIVFCVLTSLSMFTETVSANSDVNTVFKKVMLQGLQTCYNQRNGYMVDSISEIEYKQRGIDALVTSAGGADGIIKLPNSIGNTLSDADISCKQLFYGYSGIGGSASGLFKLFGKNQSSTTLGNLGYNNPTTSSGSEQRGCLSFTYSYRDGNGTGEKKDDGKTNTVCFQVDEDEKVNSDWGASYTNDETHTGPITLAYRDGNLYIYSSQYLGTGGDITSFVISYGSNSWSDISKEFTERANNINGQTWVDYGGTLIDPGYSVRNVSARTDGGSAYTEYGRSSIAGTEALRYFTGKKDDTFYAEKLNHEDLYVLYSKYLDQAIAAHKGTLYLDSACFTSKDSALAAAGSPGTDRYVVRSGSQWCPIRGVDTVPEHFNVVDSNGYKLKDGTFKDVINGLMGLDYTALEESGTNIGTITGDGVAGIDTPSGGNNIPGSDGGSSDGGSGDSLDKCYSAAASLGWIICPVTQGLGDVVDGIYSYIAGNFLEIKSSLLNSSGGNESTYDGWRIFRNFANTLFIIAFAVVILAQVTGIGISNYNIKKILPRLVMVAILVNISFVICQIAVDLSNILGSNLNKMFSDMAAQVPQPLGSPYTLGGIVKSTILTLFAGGAAVVGGLALAVSWEIWLIPFLISLIGCVIGIFFFFVILGIRQAGVIILVVLSPLAIVCYALPNTKSFFDRWKKLFVSLLLVYPICGLLMGAGEFASALLVAAGNETQGFFYMIVAMLLSVIPFFFIPSILKSSMAALGNIGMKVSQFGRNVGGRAGAFYRSSEFGREQERRLNMRNAERTYDRLMAKEQQNGRLSAGDRRKRSRAVARYNRAAYEDIRAGGTQQLLREGTPEYDAAIARESSGRFDSDIAGRQSLYSTGQMQSAFGLGQINGDDDDALQGELDGYLGKIIRNEGTASEIEDYTRNAQAIANVLSDRGTGGARARVVNSLSKAMYENQDVLRAATGDDKARLAKNFGSIGSRLNGKYGKDYKKDYPGAVAMFGDMAQGNFNRIDFKPEGATSGQGYDATKRNQRFFSDYYSGAGIDGLNAEDFSKLKAGGLDHILSGIHSGSISGARLEALGSLANTTLDPNSVLNPDSDAIPKMQQVRQAAFANSAESSSVAGRSAGSLAISSSGASGIDSLYQQMQSAPKWEDMSSDQQTEFRNLVKNMSESYTGDRFYQEDAERLRSALQIAQDKGMQVADGQVVVAPRAPARMDIEHSRQGGGTDGGQQSPLIVTPDQLSETERRVVRERAAQIDRNNRRNGR